MNSLNIGGKIIDLTDPIVMGILNITNNSFYDGGEYLMIDKAINRVKEMIKEGATIIDIGAASSKPKAPIIDPEIELKQLEPVIKEISTQFPDISLSIDTYHSLIVRELSRKYAFIVNDISSGRDPELHDVIGSLGFPYVLMHMQGNPQTMQNNPNYANVVKELLDFFSEKIRQIRDSGIDQVIVDPGFGFGKTVKHNYKLLKHMGVFRILDCPIMVGLSRKSMIYKVLGSTPKEALNGTTALHMQSLSSGAKVLRVHDVKAAVETITLWKQIRDA